MNNEHSIESSAHSDEDFRYDIVRSRHRRRTIAICIERDGRVVVRAPAKTDRDTLHQFVQKDLDQKSSFKFARADPYSSQTLSQAKFFYLGDSYPLKVTDSPNGGPPLALIMENFN
jgi:predicted metal-dependent hydrolase